MQATGRFTRSVLRVSPRRSIWNMDSGYQPRLPAEQEVPTPLLQDVRLGCVQMKVELLKEANLTRATKAIASLARTGSRIVVLPECFNSPYGTQNFPKFAETLSPSPPPQKDSPSFHALANAAKKNNVYVIGGSIPERDPEMPSRFYNTCLTFNPEGKLIDTFRKVHLFDIDIPGKIAFRESAVLSPGNKISLVPMPPYGTVAIAICYDIRFPELAIIAARKGAFALIYPGAFNLTTGALHWELLGRSRALDNQVYVAMCSPARDNVANYNAWGHSMIVDPMGRISCKADQDETAISFELSRKMIQNSRDNIPLEKQRRFDVYPDITKGEIQFEEPPTPTFD
ncbi:carbon-nitrogen hydrolase [Ophiocordyceps camponoti-floridani]|uniref:Carbon-nitrogen hydrolase n=1 Tax=Ophiocordyceps camponoti-floridani TaxID=2030778 RepID=A0A8H4QCQ7_9HYPO|nr:carbon-nitrogen hydrolase [Ophiocordyceps camponoti-floridani]